MNVRALRASLCAAPAAALAAELIACGGGGAGAGVQPALLDVSRSSSAPASPPAAICGNASILTGPAKPPHGAVTVPAGDNGKLLRYLPSDTTYWFAPGVHTLGPGPYAQIIPADGDTFVGGPGAILDGRTVNLYAFTATASHVTVEYLTIQHFGKKGDNGGQGVVNHDSGRHWTIQYDTVQDDAGAGVFIGTGGVVRYNCLTRNGEYGFQSGGGRRGAADEVLDHNEISGNNTDNWEKRVPGCGCSGAGKFWDTRRATVTNNWVHDNRGPGPWMDTDNDDFDIEGNYVNDNEAEGLIYEISYNALIKDNTFVRNAIEAGPKNPGFPTPAIYLSESGGDARVAARYSTIEVTGNTFGDNWAGIVLWENADRFCHSPENTSKKYCTLVDPKVVTLRTCVRGRIDHEPYFSDCRWKTQNVLVDHNAFTFDPADIKGCAASKSCGFQGLFSNWGTEPRWSPYKGPIIERSITFHQNDVFADNAYKGPWMFMAHDQSRVLNWGQWRARPYRQDRGSTLSR
jgi:hypothetical protein